MTWQAQAACRDQENAIFFPQRGGDAKPAKAICAVCPVFDECLDYALHAGDLQGIWAGTSERERIRLRQRRGINLLPMAQCGTRSGYLRHIKAGERACDRCLTAANEYQANWRNNGIKVAPGFGHAR